MFDLRLPIGWFFVINSVLLIGFGLISPHQVPFAGLQINLNVLWGCVMGLFGLIMLLLAFNSRLPDPRSR